MEVESDQRLLSPGKILDQFRFCFFSLRGKWWLRGGVGGQFPRNLNDPKFYLLWLLEFLTHTFSKCSDLSAEYSINISRNSTSFLQSKWASSGERSLHRCSSLVLASAQLEFAYNYKRTLDWNISVIVTNYRILRKVLITL